MATKLYKAISASVCIVDLPSNNQVPGPVVCNIYMLCHLNTAIVVSAWKMYHSHNTYDSTAGSYTGVGI